MGEIVPGNAANSASDTVKLRRISCPTPGLAGSSAPKLLNLLTRKLNTAPDDEQQSCCPGIGTHTRLTGYYSPPRRGTGLSTASPSCRRRQSAKGPQRRGSGGKPQLARKYTLSSGEEPRPRPKQAHIPKTDEGQGQGEQNQETGLQKRGSSCERPAAAAEHEPGLRQYVDATPRHLAEGLGLDDLEEGVSCLSIDRGHGQIRAVSPGIEEAYRSGEALTPPDIEFSEDSDMEDNYWTWDQETQQFRHWDEENQEWVHFPEYFD
ncbi:hypothetical protein ACJ41O_008567 [Fusarium nematophilum]